MVSPENIKKGQFHSVWWWLKVRVPAAQRVKNLPAVQESWVRSLGRDECFFLLDETQQLIHFQSLREFRQSDSGLILLTVCAFGLLEFPCPPFQRDTGGLGGGISL